MQALTTLSLLIRNKISLVFNNCFNISKMMQRNNTLFRNDTNVVCVVLPFEINKLAYPDKGGDLIDFFPVFGE